VNGNVDVKKNASKRRRAALTVFALAGALALGGTALADHHGRHRAPHAGGHGFGHPDAMMGHLFHMAQELELTDEQKVELHRIVEANMSGDLGQHSEALQEAHRNLASMLHDAESTEEQVIDASAKVSSALQEVALARHAMIRELQGILTDEQKEKLGEMSFERPRRAPRGPKGPRGPGWTAPEAPVEG